MRDTKHTLGPWVYYPESEGLYTVRSSSHGHRIAKELSSDDACLIAAAPELLEALDSLLCRLDEQSFYGPDIRYAINAATDAVKKAKGE